MTAEPLLEIAVAGHGLWTVVGIVGELDLATAPQLESACEAADDRLALDLSGVRFIDSTGLRCLVRLRNEYARLVLVAPNVSVERLLTLTKLDDEFTVVDKVEHLDAT